MDVLDFQMMRADSQTGGFIGLAGNNDGIQVCESERQGRAAAGMAFSILIMIGRFKGADGLAHQRKIACQRTDGKNQRLVRIVPGSIGMSVLVKEQRCQTAAADIFITPLMRCNFPFTHR